MQKMSRQLDTSKDEISKLSVGLKQKLVQIFF